jgi:hypothetical protein
MRLPDVIRNACQDRIHNALQELMPPSDLPGRGACLLHSWRTPLKAVRWYSRIVVLLTAFGLSAGAGCKDEGTGPDCRLLVVPAGAYFYSAFDNDGQTLVEGWFTLEFSDSSKVTGEWHFNARTDQKDIGRQVGDGKLSGSFADTLLWVDLNPGWIDNNVILHGTLDDGVYRGGWDWVTFIGVTSHGSFEAVRR